MEIMLGNDFHEDGQIKIVLHSTSPIKSSGKGYHPYKETWITAMNEKLAVFMEPDNEVDKYTVFSRKDMLLWTSYS